MTDEATGLTGVWILRSAYLERVDTGEKILPYSDNPRGVLILHEGGRMAAIITPSELPSIVMTSWTGISSGRNCGNTTG